MVFTGHYEHTVDGKSRVAIPSEWRSKLQDGDADAKSGKALVLYVSLLKDGLAVYPKAAFDRLAEELNHSQMDPKKLLHYERVFYSNSREVEVDSAGRIRLPDHLLKRAKLPSDIVLLGVKDHMEILDRARWNAEEDRSIEEDADLLMNPRQAMR